MVFGVRFDRISLIKEGALVKKLILIAALVALILGALFLWVYLESRGRPEPLRIGVENNGSTVTLEVGQTLILTLESNPTTGYSWELAEFDEAVLKLVSYDYVPDEHPPGMVGVGGKDIWYFQAQSQGSTTLHLEYVYSWEEGVEPVKTFTVQVVVR